LENYLHHKQRRIGPQAGLDPNAPGSFERVEPSISLNNYLMLAKTFFNRKLGDTFGLQRVFGLGTA